MLFAVAFIGIPEKGVADPERRSNIAESWRAMSAVCGGCLLLPFCGAAVGSLKEGLNGPKLHLLSVFGLMIGLPLLLAVAGARKVIALALFVAMTGNAAMITAQGVLRLRGREEPYPAFAAFRRLIPEPHPDIVLAPTNDFLPFYETEANRNDPENSLIYLFDTDKQLAVRGSDTPDVASRILQGRTRGRILPFDPYVATHSHFYLLSGVDMVAKDEWQFKYLLAQMHARFEWLGNVRGWDLYSVDLAR